uniref:Uncharacterized protein n=1 Tax=Salix viminalis TaxID=40686 RepID=A0A6N2KRL3_SALVM
MHQPGIEPGSVPWQGTILPLDHWCLPLSSINATRKIIPSSLLFFILKIPNISLQAGTGSYRSICTYFSSKYYLVFLRCYLSQSSALQKTEDHLRIVKD